MTDFFLVVLVAMRGPKSSFTRTGIETAWCSLQPPAIREGRRAHSPEQELRLRRWPRDLSLDLAGRRAHSPEQELRPIPRSPSCVQRLGRRAHSPEQELRPPLRGHHVVERCAGPKSSFTRTGIETPRCPCGRGSASSGRRAHSPEQELRLEGVLPGSASARISTAEELIHQNRN